MTSKRVAIGAVICGLAISGILIAAAPAGPAKVVPGDENLPAAIPLWASGAPGSQGQTSPEQLEVRTDKAKPHFAESVVGIARNVNNPSITPFLPDPAKATGAALIIAPGGGNEHLSVDREGYDVGRFLAAHGIAGFVLKYRLSAARGGPYQEIPHTLMDAQRAIRLVRSRAAEWHVDPQRVGIVGFSAGGQLAWLASSHFKDPVKGSDDAVDKLSCRPDFEGIIYGAYLDNVTTVEKDTPPTFMARAADDRISAAMMPLFTKLRDAGVSGELHVYGRAGHGFGMWPTDLPAGHWADEFVDWMKSEGLLSPAPATGAAK